MGAGEAAGTDSFHARQGRGFAVGAALNSVTENLDFASFMNFFIPTATRARAFVWQGGALQDLGTLGGHMGPAIAHDAQSKILTIDGVDEADVQLVWDPPRNQNMISEAGRMKLGMI